MWLGAISTANSSATPLAGGATFTGIGELNHAPDVMVSCKTDVSGTLYLEFSVDEGANYDTSIPFTVDGTSGDFHILVKGRRTCRVRYVNGSAAQSYLRLHTEFGAYRQPNSPINGTIASDADGLIVRAVNSELDLALGRFGGMNEDTKFGFNQDIDTTSDPEDVWCFGGVYTFSAAASTLWVASSNASDTNVDITIEGLDSTGIEISETINTNGQSGVQTSGSFLRVNRVYESGSVAALGNIAITTANNFSSGVPADATQVRAYNPIGYGQSQQCIYTVPAGKSMRIKRIVLTQNRSSGAAGSSDLTLSTRSSGKTWRVRRRYSLYTGAPLDIPEYGLVCAALTDVKMRVESVSDNDTDISAQWAFDLVNI